VYAADPPGFAHYTSAELKGYEQKLAPKINERKIAFLPLADWGNHTLAIAHREGDGEAELHEKQADLFIVQSGEGTLVVGGKIVNPRTTTPGEVRGPSIQGGVRRQMRPGDVLHIPANTPHQALVAAGRQFTYVAVKVTVH
jgi:mannose-6-phosphate isomerase-like protein (cupin superfamily)